MTVTLGISGIQQAQQANLKMIASLKPNGSLARAIKYGTIQAERYAVSITHVDTGGLRASHRIKFRSYPAEGTIYLDPAARNPRRRNAKPSTYGFYEHNRGGSHAFYERTADEAGPSIIDTMISIYRQGLP